MATFNLRRFSKPEMLRRIDRKHLIAFLEPHAAYFSARGVELPPVQQEDGLDYNALSHLLLTPDSTTPDDLAEALFYVNEVSTPEGFDSIQDEIAGTDIDVEIGENAAPADLAIQVWAPTRLHLSPTVETLLAQKDSLFIALNEDLYLGDAPRFLTRRDRSEIFAPLIGQVPEPDSGGTVFFPTPPGTTWPQIKIQFRDGHTVTIWAGEKTGRYSYGEMGMLNRKNNKPTVQWRWLEGFANSHGEIDWKNKYSAVTLKKQKQELSKRLRAFFRIEDDPIEWIKGTKTYRCKFRILPEGDEVY